MTDIFSSMPAVGSAQAQTVTAPKPMTVNDALASSAVKNTPSDSVEISGKAKEKKGPIKTVKGFIGSVKKFFSNVGEYSKGIAKGVRDGAIGASLIYTGGSIINHFKDKAAAKAAAEGVEKVVKKVPNRALAAGVAVAAVAANLWTASLNATEKQSQIDHRWTGHKN